MGVIVTGHNSPTGFQNSEAVTVSNLNSHVNDSTFATGSVDNSSIELTNNNTKLQLKNSTSTTTGTTLAKLQYIGSGKILGRASANDGIVEQLTLDTDLSTVSASHNELASSKAIKDYIASVNSQFFHLQQKNNSGDQSTDSLTVGQYVKRSVVSQGNTITGASESSSVITLPAGTYEIKAFGMARSDGNGNTPHRLRLRNTTDNTTSILGGCVVTIGQSSLDNEAIPAAPLQGYISIGGTKTFELQHYVGDGSTPSASAVAGGYPVGSGESEVYADILIRKVN